MPSYSRDELKTHWLRDGKIACEPSGDKNLLAVRIYTGDRNLATCRKCQKTTGDKYRKNSSNYKTLKHYKIDVTNEYACYSKLACGYPVKRSDRIQATYIPEEVECVGCLNYLKTLH